MVSSTTMPSSRCRPRRTSQRVFQHTAQADVAVPLPAQAPVADSDGVLTLVPRDALVLSGVAVCSESSGLTTVTWTVSNNTGSPIAGTDLQLAFGVSGVTVAAGGSESADQVIVGPAQATVVENEFYGASGSGAATVPFYAYGSVSVAACVASGTTTTAASTTSTVAPSTTAPAVGVGGDGRGGV